MGIHSLTPKDGTHPAKAGGHALSFNDGVQDFIVLVDKAVKGVDVPCNITIKNGQVVDILYTDEKR